MKLTKRIITALLILAMLFVSAGCGGKDAQQSDSSTDTRQEQTKTDGKRRIPIVRMWKRLLTTRM